MATGNSTLKETAGNLVMAGGKVTGLAAGTVAGDSVRFEDAVATTKLTSNLLVLSTSLATGTAEPLPLADALFTGKAAGGLAGPAAGGTLGIIAGSFASSGAETGTGSGQGGLSSTPATTQPYNATDFPGGQFFGDLFKNGSPVLLLDMLSTASVSFPASVNAPVIVFFSYRSDLAADAKWRAWFYFVNQATGNFTSFTPTTNVTGCTLRCPQVVTIANQPTAQGLAEAPAVPAAADIEFGLTADLVTLGTAAAAGATGKVMDAGTTLAHGAQTVDTLHALATSSAHGFQDKADKQFRDRLFTDGIRSALVEKDDFSTGGSYAAGAAAVPTTVNFGDLSWRCVLSGAAAAMTFVTTNQDATHQGIVELNTGTAGTGVSTATRKANGVSSGRILGSNQLWTQEWLVRIPTLSDGTNTYALRFGWHDGTSGAPTNGVYVEYDSTASANWRGITNNAGTSTVASGGTATPVAAGAWLRLTITWDGTTATGYVEGVSLGTSTTNIPTAAVPDAIQILKSAGGTARTTLWDYFWQELVWTTPRAA